MLAGLLAPTAFAAIAYIPLEPGDSVHATDGPTDRELEIVSLFGQSVVVIHIAEPTVVGVHVAVRIYVHWVDPPRPSRPRSLSPEARLPPRERGPPEGRSTGARGQAVHQGGRGKSKKLLGICHQSMTEAARGPCPHACVASGT